MKMLTGNGDTVVIYSTTTRYFWLTGWVRCHGVTTADFLVNFRDLVGSAQVKPAYQTAAVIPELPDSPTVITAGSYVTTASFTHFRETLSLTSKYWIRFGVAASNTSGVALGSGDVGMQVALDQVPVVLGMEQIVINPGQISGTDTNVFEVGEWSPTVGLDKVMAAIAVMDNLSTYLELSLHVRTCKVPSQPNSWVQVEAAWDNPASGNSVRNTTALSLPAGANASTNFLFQLGMGVRKKSGAAGNPRAQVVVGAVRSST